MTRDLSESKVEKQFQAAVKIIQELPQDGPFQPSKSLMIKFYGLYKQSTEGPCHGSRPSFWDVINRAKYDEWSSLGNMSKQTAMSLYVEELKNIIETMSYNSEVAGFLKLLGPFYEFVDDDDDDEDDGDDDDGDDDDDDDEEEEDVYMFNKRVGLVRETGQYFESDSDTEILEESTVSSIKEEEDEFLDTLNFESSTHTLNHWNEKLDNSTPDEKVFTTDEVMDIIRYSIDDLTLRLTETECSITKLQKALEQNKTKKKAFQELSGKTWLCIITWPVVVQLIVLFIKSRRS